MQRWGFASPIAFDPSRLRSTWSLAWAAALVVVSWAGCAEWRPSSPFEMAQEHPARHSLKALRDQHVVKQDQDYSCGAAAMATLMQYYFGDDTSEKKLLDVLQANLSEQELVIKRLSGFSLLDLKRAAHAQGYRAAGFTLTLAQLAQLKVPVIVFIQPMGYKHFAVIRGIDRGRVYLADPSRGNLRMSVGRFLDEWSGIVFVLGRADEDQIESYPLMIPRPDDVQPELRRTHSLIDLGIHARTLPLR